jgi:hypothetical protein
MGYLLRRGYANDRLSPNGLGSSINRSPLNQTYQALGTNPSGLRILMPSPDSVSTNNPWRLA